MNSKPIYETFFVGGDRKYTRDEAVELMIHHLRMASMFFEVTPDDNGEQVMEEYTRLVARDCAYLTPQGVQDHLEIRAARLYVGSLVKSFEEFKANG